MMNSMNELPAQSGNTKSLMILLHGVGSNGDDLFSLAPYFAQSLTDTHFFSPDGIESCDMVPFGYQWFSFRDRSNNAIISELERVAPIIDAMIEKKQNELSLKSEDVILCGFSQGSMVSMYLALSSAKTYKAIIAFSGALILPKIVHKTSSPICLIHGMEDEVVPYANMDAAYKQIQDLGMTVEAFARPNLAHSIDIEGLKKAAAFIQNRS